MFLLMTPSSWQMIHTQYLSCQKIPPGVPPTRATVPIKLDCSRVESHHTHRWGKTQLHKSNRGGGRKDKGRRWENHPEFPTSLTSSLELPYSYTFNAGVIVIRSPTYKGETVSEDVYCLWPWMDGEGIYRKRQLMWKNESPPVLSLGLG